MRATQHRLAEKLQWLVLNHPIAAVEVEKLIDRLRIAFDASQD
jgi:hypothetical protein